MYVMLKIHGLWMCCHALSCPEHDSSSCASECVVPQSPHVLIDTDYDVEPDINASVAIAQTVAVTDVDDGHGQEDARLSPETSLFASCFPDLDRR